MWSDLTTGVQIADLVSYPVSWGVRFQGTDLPAREELEDELLAAKIKEKRHCGANATKSIHKLSRFRIGFA